MTPLEPNHNHSPFEIPKIPPKPKIEFRPKIWLSAIKILLIRIDLPLNRPYYHGLNYITEEDLTLRKTLLSTKMKAPYETDFVFVLNRLRNHLHTDQGEMNLLIAETIVFEKGIPKYILKKGARNEPGKYSYFEEKEKLNSLEIKKYLFKRKKVKRYLEEFLPENLEARLRRSKNGSKAGKTARKKKAVSSFTLSKEKLLQMDYERRKKREEARNRFRIYFSKIGGEWLFIVFE